jgi:flagellar motor switch protein FliN/FliY
VTDDRLSPARWFAEEWTVLFGNVLEALAGERPQLACSAPAGEATAAARGEEIGREHGAILWWEQRLVLPGDPAIWIGAPRNAWSQLAGRVLGAAGVEDDSQSRETYLEILQQSMGELSRNAGRLWNRPIGGSGQEASGAPQGGESYLVGASYPDATLPPLILVVTGAPQDPPRAADATEAPADQLWEPRSGSKSRTFDLLMEVELPVSVSFGHVQLPLGEVLKLTAGSIIELNRTVDEPVEVIVNNCIVARGEVVVVEGNYGVRIHQIVSRQERLESLP